MKQARHLDEHGLDPTMHHAMNFGLVRTGPVRQPRTNSLMPGILAVNFAPDPGLTLTIESKAALVTVHDDRFGDTFSPPETHLGARLADNSPITAGALMVQYLGQMLAEAADLPKRV